MAARFHNDPLGCHTLNLPVIAPLTASVPSLFRQDGHGVVQQGGWFDLPAFADRAGVLWLYSGGGVQDRATQTIPPIQVTALVDTSTSMVSPSANVAAYGQSRG